MRCVPGTAFLAGAFYTDLNCQNPIIRVSANDCSAVGYYYGTVETAIDPTLDIWWPGIQTIVARGERVAAPTTLFTKSYGGGCTDVSTSIAADDSFYAGTAADITQLAHATFSQQQSASGALRRPLITTDENLQVHDYFYGDGFDTGLNAHCFFGEDGTSGACEPSLDVVQVVDTDMTTCQVPAIAHRSVGTQPAFASYNGNFYAVTQTQTGVEAYDPNDSCGTLGSYDIYTLGAQKMLQVGVESKSGAGRIQKARITADGLNWVIGFWDSQSNESCVEAIAADGVMRCITEATYASRRFSDAACTDPLASSESDTDTPSVVILPATACGAQYQIYTVTGTGAVATQPHMKTVSGSCVLADQSYWRYRTYITYSSEVSPSTYPEITDD